MTMTTGPLRVLHVLGRLERGGAELRTVELAEYFPPDRVRSDFLVLSGLDGALDNRVRTAGGEVLKCRLDARFPLTFVRLLKDRRYDVVHSHVHFFSGVILALARAAGVSCRVSQLHTAVVNDREDTLRRRLQLAVSRRLLDRSATDIVAVGEGTMNAVWRREWTADPRCRVIYFGVKGDRLRAAACERSGTPTIVNVASVKRLKNQRRLVDILARVAARIPSVQLLLIGREVGAYGHEVRRAVDAAGLTPQVRLVGEVDDPLPWMASARLMILPSLWEGLPCAALEACALGTPVLATDLPGTRELARYFPYLRVMSLQESDDAWAAAAAGLIDAGPPAARDAAACLARSPFAFEQSCEGHYAIWRRARAAA